MKFQYLRLSSCTMVSLLALVFSLGTDGHAANTLGSSDIIDESMLSQNLTLGSSVSGLVSLNGVPNGRCRQIILSVAGAQPGQVASVATRGTLQNGIVLYAAERVKLPNQVEAVICNFSGTGMIPIVNLPVRVITSTELVNTIVGE